MDNGQLRIDNVRTLCVRVGFAADNEDDVVPSATEKGSAFAFAMTLPYGKYRMPQTYSFAVIYLKPQGFSYKTDRDIWNPLSQNRIYCTSEIVKLSAIRSTSANILSYSAAISMSSSSRSVQIGY